MQILKYLVIGSLSSLVTVAIADDMVQVESGIYRPLYLTEDTPLTKVPEFKIDVYPVTNEDFQKFVEKEPKWQKNNIAPIFAEENYLFHWQKKDEGYAPLSGDLKKPVTNISWFSAEAYCQAQGKQLPTVAQWEYVAQASETSPKGYNEPGYTQRILDWYGRSATKKLANVGESPKNYWGIYDLHGLIWEWTYDFNDALVDGDSRGDGTLNQQMFCGSGAAGAADPSDYAAFMRYGFRSSLQSTYTLNQLGFRCAVSK